MSTEEFKEHPYLGSSFIEEGEDGEQVGLVSVFVPEVGYYNLLEAYQDRAAVNLDLNDSSQQIEGLFSRDFAACVAIILRSEDSSKISLMHISSIYDRGEEAEWFKDEVAFVSNSNKNDYSIELGISKEGYEISYDKKDSGSKKPDDFVTEKIASIKAQIISLTNKEVSVVHKLPYSMILIDIEGTVINFEGINRDEIEVVPQENIVSQEEVVAQEEIGLQKEVNDDDGFSKDPIELPSAQITESSRKGPLTVDSKLNTQVVADSFRFLHSPMEKKSKRKLPSDQVLEDRQDPKRHQTKEEMVELVPFSSLPS
ncbi:MAG TPA: hypothetical protein VHE99_12090 [Gammaproteobacteria bacterium]|nr:hypothetical protein [Gammaproteobacteria bacterium]